jgi:hypothetical protein
MIWINKNTKSKPINTRSRDVTGVILEAGIKTILAISGTARARDFSGEKSLPHRSEYERSAIDYDKIIRMQKPGLLS